MSTVADCVCEPGFTEDACLDSGCRACGDDMLGDPCREGRSEPTSHAGAANAHEVQARINRAHERVAMARGYYVPVVRHGEPTSDDELDRMERALDRVENSQVFNEALRGGENPYLAVARAVQRRTAGTGGGTA